MTKETELQKFHKDWARQVNDALKEGAYKVTDLWLVTVVVDPAAES